MPIIRDSRCHFFAWVLYVGAYLATLLVAAAAAADPIATDLVSGEPARVESAVGDIRAGLLIQPGDAIDRLNATRMAALLRAKQYDAVIEFSTKGVLALPADTWRIEGLYRHRIRARLALGQTREALADARALFNVAGVGFTMNSVDLLAECLDAAHPESPGMGNRFRLQVLAGAETDEAKRGRAVADAGESILAKVAIDPTPWAEAIEMRSGKTGYRIAYGTANLLLLAGRTAEARQAFEAIWKSRPAGEDRYAAEGFAKAIKADTGMIGPANLWIRSVRFPERK